MSVLDAPGSREYHILCSFTDRRSLRAWLDSEERRRLLDRVAELLEADRGLQQLTGLDTWFKLVHIGGTWRVLFSITSRNHSPARLARPGTVPEGGTHYLVSSPSSSLLHGRE